MRKDEQNIEEFKIILLGNSGVGKTSILERYAYNRFNEELLATLGLNFITEQVTLDNFKRIELKIWDTAGQEKFRSLSKSYFRNVDAVLFVFAINDSLSFENIKDWIELYNNNHNGKKNIPLYLIENKNDLERKVETNLIDNFLIENTNLKYKSLSAKLDNDNEISKLFKELGEILYNNHINGNEKVGQKYLHLNPRKRRKKKVCCQIESDDFPDPYKKK